MKTSQSSRINEGYTIVIFRGSTAKPWRVSIPKHWLKRALIVALCVVLGDLALIGHYVIRTGQVWELESLQTEVLSARQQTAAFSTAVEELKRRTLSVKEMNQRMRVMLGIDVERPNGDMLNGQGGEDTPLVGASQPDDVTPSMAPVKGPKAPDSSKENLEQPTALNDFRDDAQAEALARHVTNEIAWLKNEIGFQEVATATLLQEAEKRSARWDSTPSIWPVKGWVTSSFGPRVSPFTGRPALHDGLDVGAGPNTPVQAPASGRVTAVGFNEKLGNIVRLDHGYGIQTLYGHMAKYLVKNGQRVKRGDVIGLVGSTGLSTGPHLHYTIKVRGRAVNPRKYILD